MAQAFFSCSHEHLTHCIHAFCVTNVDAAACIGSAAEATTANNREAWSTNGCSSSRGSLCKQCPITATDPGHLSGSPNRCGSFRGPLCRQSRITATATGYCPWHRSSRWRTRFESHPVLLHTFVDLTQIARLKFPHKVFPT